MKVTLTVWSMLAVVERNAELATILLQTGNVRLSLTRQVAHYCLSLPGFHSMK